MKFNVRAFTSGAQNKTNIEWNISSYERINTNLMRSCFERSFFFFPFFEHGILVVNKQTTETDLYHSDEDLSCSATLCLRTSNKGRQYELITFTSLKIYYLTEVTVLIAVISK